MSNILMALAAITGAFIGMAMIMIAFSFVTTALKGQRKDSAQTQLPLNLDDITEVTLSSDETCAICMDDIPAGDVAKSLQCNHQFHGECILAWWSKQVRRGQDSATSCPLCRCIQPMPAEAEARV
ncbi:E3 ubiquitin-protein ligase Praja-1 (Praja1) (RING finger protein 70) (RING-type E3 ubiquitin transferase Praja-1) [Durusdinium trenchii]|uniref:E3 ubiquitin-protein ligase Praja-1 (Praja1) (RING finger protein 70) (RING-type E3 ubiquitin transferase Praja-1) n=1 Tax=Durusdinium trenchii TaxID=1381693 RepID=A0ABP0KPN4_9DINO